MMTFTLRPVHRATPQVWLVTLAVTLLYKTLPVAANYEHHCDSSSFRYQRNGHCGVNLARNVQLICNRFQNSFKHVMKRDPQKATDAHLTGIGLSKRDAFSYLSKRQASQNIVCECCVHRCSLDEMTQYCELPSATYARRPRSGLPAILGPASLRPANPTERTSRPSPSLETTGYSGGLS